MINIPKPQTYPKQETLLGLSHLVGDSGEFAQKLMNFYNDNATQEGMRISVESSQKTAALISSRFDYYDQWFGSEDFKGKNPIKLFKTCLSDLQAVILASGIEKNTPLLKAGKKVIAACEKVIDYFNKKNSLSPLELNKLYRFLAKFHIRRAFALATESSANKQEALDHFDEASLLNEKNMDLREKERNREFLLTLRSTKSEVKTKIGLFEHYLKSENLQFAQEFLSCGLPEEEIRKLNVTYRLRLQKVYAAVAQHAKLPTLTTVMAELSALQQKYREELAKLPEMAGLKIVCKKDIDVAIVPTTLNAVPEKVQRILRGTGFLVKVTGDKMAIGPLTTGRHRVMPKRLLIRCVQLLQKEEKKVIESQNRFEELKKAQQAGISELSTSFADLQLVPPAEAPSKPDSAIPVSHELSKSTKRRDLTFTAKKETALVPLCAPASGKDRLNARELLFSKSVFQDFPFYECRTRGVRHNKVWVVLGELSGDRPDESTILHMLNSFTKAKIVPARREKGFKFIGDVLYLKDASAFRLCPTAVQRNIHGDIAFLYGRFRNTKTGIGAKNLDVFLKDTCVDYGTKGKKKKQG